MKSCIFNLSIIGRIVIALSLGIFISHSALANTCQDIDKVLATHYDSMSEHSSYYHNNALSYKDNEANFNDATDSFYRAIGRYIVINDITCPLILTQKAGVNVKDSADGNFRTISWDELNGGTMHFFDGIVHYKGEHMTHVLTHAIEGYVNTLQMLHLPQESGDHRKVYALVERHIGSGRDHSHSIKLYKIVNEKLIYPDIIKTTSRTTNEIYYSFDTMSLNDKYHNEYPSISINPKDNTITFPVVLASKKYPSGQVTDRKIKYQFKNDYFIKVAP